MTKRFRGRKHVFFVSFSSFSLVLMLLYVVVGLSLYSAHSCYAGIVFSLLQFFTLVTNFARWQAC